MGGKKNAPYKILKIIIKNKFRDLRKRGVCKTSLRFHIPRSAKFQFTVRRWRRGSGGGGKREGFQEWEVFGPEGIKSGMII